jgi:transposase InsO family protein
MRLSLEQRRLVKEAKKRNIKTSRIAEVFGVSQKTVRRWVKRRTPKEKIRKAKESKVTLEVELAILAMRTMFEWGTARIQQGLISLPPYAKEALQNYVENVLLSRTAINAILTKHKLNGYKTKSTTWKFFRAKAPNELWQLDMKGPFTVQGRKYYFVICIDDYSRYLLISNQIMHVPKTKEITAMLGSLPVKPKKILTDNAKQFAEQWKTWCKENGITPIYAHPYYPQDKGKVERAIRTVAEEFIHLLRKFPEWLEGKIEEYRVWFNNERFHRGINDYPARLYGTLET